MQSHAAWKTRHSIVGTWQVTYPEIPAVPTAVAFIQWHSNLDGSVQEMGAVKLENIPGTAKATRIFP